MLGDVLIGTSHGPEGLGFLPQHVLQVLTLGLPGEEEEGKLGLEVIQEGQHTFTLEFHFHRNIMTMLPNPVLPSTAGTAER